MAWLSEEANLSYRKPLEMTTDTKHNIVRDCKNLIHIEGFRISLFLKKIPSLGHSDSCILNAISASYANHNFLRCDLGEICTSPKHRSSTFCDLGTQG